jgi:hypothetical protein
MYSASVGALLAPGHDEMRRTLFLSEYPASDGCFTPQASRVPESTVVQLISGQQAWQILRNRQNLSWSTPDEEIAFPRSKTPRFFSGAALQFQSVDRR